MRAEVLLKRRRAAAEALMVDACRITAPGEVVTDPDTGNVTTTRTTVYEGRCKVQSREGTPSTPEAGGASFTIVSSEVHIPFGAADVKDGHEVELTSSLFNPFASGKVYRVHGFTPDTWDTAFRLPVKEIL